MPRAVPCGAPNTAVERINAGTSLYSPEGIRKQLKLKSGSRFVVIGKDDVIILKTIAPPSMLEFNGLVTEARRQAKKAGLKRSDISDAIARVRRRK